MIELKEIYKKYDKHFHTFNALDGITLKLNDAGFYTIIGESGSGKSTLLNIISMLDFPTKGKLIIDGKEIAFDKTDENDKLRNELFSLVYEENNFFESATLFDNLETVLNINNCPIDMEQIFKYLELLELRRSLLDQKIKNFSGGELKRAYILRALLLNRKYILMDEPTSSLDFDSAEQIFKILRKLSCNHMILITTHDKKFANKYSDEVIEMKNGKIKNINKINHDEEQKETITSKELDYKNKEKARKGSSKTIYKNLIKSNFLLYFLVFIFTIVFSNGIDMLLSCTKNFATPENLQEEVNKDYCFAYCDIENYDHVLEFKKYVEEKYSCDSLYFNYRTSSNNYYNFIKSEDYNRIASKYNFEIKYGDVSKQENEIMIPYGMAMDMAESLETGFENLIGEDFNITIYGGNYNTLNFIISGIYDCPKMNRLNQLVITTSKLKDLIGKKIVNEVPDFARISLKGDNFINITDNMIFDSESYDYFDKDNDKVKFEFSDIQLIDFYNQANAPLSSSLYITPLLEIVISLIFLITLFYIILSKNKETISLYRTLGVRWKKSFNVQATIITVLVAAATLISMPISWVIIKQIVLQFNNRSEAGLQFEMYRFLPYFTPITLVLTLCIELFILYIFLRYIYKKKKFIKM